ncbi:trans-sialidase [Trypanosoma cruzi]|nr:trans-sialidase [Trypanosoma cruzi]
MDGCGSASACGSLGDYWHRVRFVLAAGPWPYPVGHETELEVVAVCLFSSSLSIGGWLLALCAFVVWRADPSVTLTVPVVMCFFAGIPPLRTVAVRGCVGGGEGDGVTELLAFSHPCVGSCTVAGCFCMPLCLFAVVPASSFFSDRAFRITLASPAQLSFQGVRD